MKSYFLAIALTVGSMTAAQAQLQMAPRPIAPPPPAAVDVEAHLNRWLNTASARSTWQRENCDANRAGLLNTLATAEARDFHPLRNSSEAWIQRLWQTRQALRDRHLPSLSAECEGLMRDGLRVSRYIEDYLLLGQSGLTPSPPLTGPRPQLLTKRAGPLLLQSGDVLLSRADAFTSAAIARVTLDEAQFSHLTLVYIDAPVGTQLTLEEALTDERAFVVEAHIEVGSFVRGLRPYLQEHKSRLSLYRFRGSPAVAHAAAKQAFDYVRQYQEASRQAAGRPQLSVNDNPPYDFTMDMNDDSALFCSEIISLGYRRAGVPDVPRYPSLLQKNALTQRLGIKVERTFAPADIDMDPQFELLAEWRNPSTLGIAMRKDLILNRIYNWLNTRDYQLRNNPLDVFLARAVLIARQLELGFHERLPRNMPAAVVSLTFVLDRVGKVLDAELSAFEGRYLQQHGLRPLFPEKAAFVEELREEDVRRWQQMPGNSQAVPPRFIEYLGPPEAHQGLPIFPRRR